MHPIVAAIFTLSLSATAWAQDAPKASSAKPASPGDAKSAAVASTVQSTDPSESVSRARLHAFVDALVESYRQRDQIAGITVAIVQDDQVTLLKGYGHADLDPRREVDPAQTLFRIGSVSKTFTYSAAMQLIEQGKLGLDDPINDRLPEGLRVPDEGFREPIRVRHLFTHSAGYEDTALGHLFMDEPARVMPLEQYLVEHRPHRVREAGTQAVYSNYSVGLLGAVVAEVSGEHFEDYIERHISGPLGMASTTFREPLTAADPRNIDPTLAARSSVGFARKAGAFEAMAFEHIAQIAPAGSASSTAADMARFMRMHLRGGELDGTRVLSQVSAQAMRQVLFSNAPGVNGLAYGFMTDRIGPHFAYGHGGATLYFHTAMTMVPDLGLGVFISSNTETGRRFVREFTAQLVEFLDPQARPQPSVPFVLDQATLSGFAGNYLSNRRAYHSVEKLLASINGFVQVAAVEGGLLVSTPGESVRYVATGPRSFSAVEGHGRVEFLADKYGAPVALAASSGIVVADRIDFLRLPRTLAMLLAASTLVAVFSLRGMLKRRRKRVMDRYSPRQRPGLAVVTALSLLINVSWLVAIALGIWTGISLAIAGNAVVFSYPSNSLVALLVATTSAAIMTLLGILALLPVWRSKWQAGGKLAYTVGIAVFALTVWVMLGWNLVGLRT